MSIPNTDTLELKHGKGNPRNSEGSFVALKDGRILFVYTRYCCGEKWDDHCPADLAALESADGGITWENPRILVKNPALNAMSVSLLRLQDGRIALAYLLKSAIPGSGAVDCRPMISFSADEGESWSPPQDIAGIPPVYLVLNNDRIIQCKSGRLIVPLCFHRYLPGTGSSGYGRGIVLHYLSDDGGKSWRQAEECVYPPPGLDGGFEEPGIIELKDGRLLSWFRTSGGCQYKSFSFDGGESWSVPVPAPEFLSSRSPLSMKRDPETGELYAIWNDWHPRHSVHFAPESWGRTPLVIARSHDEGRTWVDHTVLENAPDHGYCYTAMLFHAGKLLLAYCCGGGKTTKVLQDSRIRLFDPVAMSSR